MRYPHVAGPERSNLGTVLEFGGCERLQIAADTRPRLMLICKCFGPYHYARLKALARIFDVLGVQWFGRETERGWGLSVVPDCVRLWTCTSPNKGGESRWRTVWSIVKAIRRFEPAVVLFSGYSDLPHIFGAAAAKLLGSHAVVLFDSTAMDRPRQRWKEKLKGLLLLALFDAAIVAGKRSATYVKDLGMKSNRVGYFCDVVDNDYFCSESPESNSNDLDKQRRTYRPYFLFVGRLSVEKNLDTLLSAYSTYRKEGGTWNLVIVGQGPLGGQLRALAKGVEGVHFVGAQPLQALVRYYQGAEALVLTSQSESWGLVVNEAMAAGLPILVSRRCGCSDDLVVGGENGWTFDHSEPNELVRSMLALEACDPGTRAAMGQRSREIITKFSPDGFAGEVERIYAGLSGTDP